MVSLEGIKQLLLKYKIVDIKIDFQYKGIGEGGWNVLILKLEDGNDIELTLEDYNYIINH